MTKLLDLLSKENLKNVNDKEAFNKLVNEIIADYKNEFFEFLGEHMPSYSYLYYKYHSLILKDTPLNKDGSWNLPTLRIVIAKLSVIISMETMARFSLYVDNSSGLPYIRDREKGIEAYITPEKMSSEKLTELTTKQLLNKYISNCLFDNLDIDEYLQWCIKVIRYLDSHPICNLIIEQFKIKIIRGYNPSIHVYKDNDWQLLNVKEVNELFDYLEKLQEEIIYITSNAPDFLSI